MKLRNLTNITCGLIVVTGFSLFSCEKNVSKKPRAEANLSATKADTAVEGSLKFFEENDGRVTMKLDITVPKKANSSVAVHIHEHGMCGKAGADAHGHWNPTGKPHGKWGNGEFHAGDIGNITLDAKGKGKLSLTTKLWSISGSDVTNIIGKGVIVHSGVDDYTSQPAGNSGSRIGCASIDLKQ